MFIKQLHTEAGPNGTFPVGMVREVDEKRGRELCAPNEHGDIYAREVKRSPDGKGWVFAGELPKAKPAKVAAAAGADKK